MAIGKNSQPQTKVPFSLLTVWRGMKTKKI